MFEVFSDIPFVSLFLKFMIASTVLLGAVWLLEKIKILNKPDLAELAWKLAIVGSFIAIIPPLDFMSSTVVVESDRTAALVSELNEERPLREYAVQPNKFTPVFVSPIGNADLPGKLGQVRSRVQTSSPAAQSAMQQNVRPTTTHQHTQTGTQGHGDASVVPFADRPTGGRSLTIGEAILQLFSGLYAKDFVAIGWIALAGLTLFALLLSYRDAVNSLGSRQRVGAEEKASKTLRAICEKADIRHVPYLSRSSDINSPVCLPYREICLPDWAFETMPEAEFKSLLAHELGHMVRRDPVMLMVLRALSRIFFFQPLFIIARRRLTDVAELAADEWAAKQATNSRAVANALYFCATKIQETRQIEWGLAMAGNKSILKRRVERLVDAQHTPFKAASAFSKTAIAVGVLALSLGLPSIEFAHAKVTAEPPKAVEPVKKVEAPKPKRIVVIERKTIGASKAATAPNMPVAPIVPVPSNTPVTGTHVIDEHEMEIIVRGALENARAEIDSTEIDKMVLDALRDADV
ncbi:MAG: M56 family metallopeptidase, partial [Kordiimonadaceae bacterium]|nr:M56 family metallopeptidase [Kordiimonadaceae bacterium]